MILRSGEPVRLHPAAFRPLAGPVDVVELEHLAIGHRGLDRPHHGRDVEVAALLQEVNARHELARALPVRARHRGDELAERGAGGVAERDGAARGERHCDRGGLVGAEVQRREAHGRIDRVAAAGAGRRPDRDARLLERRDVALDRAHADLEAVGEVSCRPSPGGGGPQQLDDRVEPVGAVHDDNLPGWNVTRHPELNQI